MTTSICEATEKRIQNDLSECRRLFTRSVTDIPRYSTLEKIQEDYPGFVRELFGAHKVALKILIDGILHLEDLLAQTDATFTAECCKTKTAKLTYWKHLLELSYNTFVWVHVGMDRSNVKKVFKGPKYGDLAHQNVEPVLAYISEVNKNSNEIAIPLDFCSFSPICDILKISFSESDKVLQRDFIEAKSGKVNDAMLETIGAGTMAAYFAFFGSYGEKGIKQMKRYFRQMLIAETNRKLVDAQPGVYENPENPEQRLIILADEAEAHRFSDKVAHLLEKADRKEFAVDQVDKCLVIGAINAEDEKIMMLGEFDVRLYIYHLFINPSALYGTTCPPDLPKILNTIKLIDWREGFGSVVLEPITMRVMPDQHLTDLLLGRKRLKFFFNPHAFVALCNENGLNADLITKKKACRVLRSGSTKGLVAFDGRFIRFSFGDLTTILGEGTFHEMVFNWVHPASVIDRIKRDESLTAHFMAPN